MYAINKKSRSLKEQDLILVINYMKLLVKSCKDAKASNRHYFFEFAGGGGGVAVAGAAAAGVACGCAGAVNGAVAEVFTF